MDTFERYFKSVNNPDDHVFTPDEDVLHFIERCETEEFNVMFTELNIPFNYEKNIYCF